MCSHLSEKRQKAVFGGLDEFQNHTNEGKSGEEERIRKEDKEEKRKKQCMVAVLMFNMANRWAEKVNLAVMFSRNNPAKITRHEIKQPLLSF